MAEESDGWPYVLVGEPGVAIDKLDLKAIDNTTGKEIQYVAVLDEPRRKVIRVFTTVPLKEKASFDVTLKFHWPTAGHDPND